MWTFKKKFYFALYKIFAQKLPKSQHSSFAKKARCFWAKRIVSKFGKNVNIEKNAYFGPLLEIGDNSGIGVDCEIYGPVTIGKNVMMGPEVVIYTTGHKHDRIDIPMIEQGLDDAKPVVICDDVWIGRRAMIMPGVKIGKGCIVGAGAVVTKNIPDYSIVGGTPARVVKSRI